MQKISLALLIFTFISMGVSAQKKLTPVSAESKVHFVIKNLGINTGGDLSDLKGTIVIDTKNPEKSSADVTASVSTIDTDNDRRDGHLKNEDFFDMDKYPVIRIKSKSILKSSVPGEFIFKGDLTIKDVTSPLTFTFTPVPLNGGYLLTGAFTINRLTYHVGKESATMSDEVQVSLKVFAK